MTLPNEQAGIGSMIEINRLADTWCEERQSQFGQTKRENHKGT